MNTYCFSSGNGLGIRVVGGKEIPGSRGEIGAYIAKVIPGGAAEQTGKFVEGKWLFASSDNIYLNDKKKVFWKMMLMLETYTY